VAEATTRQPVPRRWRWRPDAIGRSWRNGQCRARRQRRSPWQRPPASRRSGLPARAGAGPGPVAVRAAAFIRSATSARRRRESGPASPFTFSSIISAAAVFECPPSTRRDDAAIFISRSRSWFCRASPPDLQTLVPPPAGFRVPRECLSLQQAITFEPTDADIAGLRPPCFASAPTRGRDARFRRGLREVEARGLASWPFFIEGATPETRSSFDCAPTATWPCRRSTRWGSAPSPATRERG
jgi:hypothetical protein